MKIKYLVLPLIFLLGCDKENSNDDQMVEYMRNGRAADINMSRVSPSHQEKKSGSMSSHPLNIYFVPHGMKALRYIGEFWIYCDELHQAYTKDGCNKAVERGIRVGKSVGIDLERKDLVNENYWKKISELAREKVKYTTEETSKIESTPFSNKIFEWHKEFELKELDLVKYMDENYGH